MATTFASLGLGQLSLDEKRQVIRDLRNDLENSNLNTRQFPAEFNSWEEWIFHIDREVAEQLERERQAEVVEPLIRCVASELQ